MATDATLKRPKVAKAPVSPWILGPRTDLVLIVGSPLIVISGLVLARSIWSAIAISSFVMIWQVGHHLPGMMRAYGDPALFRRFRVRFIVAPLLLLAACSFAFYTGITGGLLGITAVWGWWHYLMQAYGFCRIYDSKVGSFAAPTRWLDQAMCLTWFAAAVVLNDNTLYGFVQNFYNGGLSVPSVAFIQTLQAVVKGATAAITTLFVANIVAQAYRGHRPNWIKIVLMLTTFGCFWYSTATVTNLIVAYAFFELFHDAQYLTIVWAFNRNRVNKDKELKGFTRWLFQPRVALIAVYLVLIAAYGSLKYGSTLVSDAKLHALLTSVFITSTLLHYYFDGFIWKLRESATSQSLNIENQSSVATRWLMSPHLRHGILWCLFVIPFLTMLFTQVDVGMKLVDMEPQQRMEKIGRDMQQLATAMPGSYVAQFSYGSWLERVGQTEAAVAAYQQALQSNPDYGPAQERLAVIKQRLGAGVGSPGENAK